MGPCWGLLATAERTVTNLLDRYDELRSLATADPQRLGPLLRPQGRVILAIDGLQPDVGHEVLWVLRDCLSGEILLAKSLLSSTAQDLAGLIDQVRKVLPVPITGVVSDGQESIRNAVAIALKGVPHQLCHFHYFREAAKPIYEADRHAKKELKKRVRGIRKIERSGGEGAGGRRGGRGGGGGAGLLRRGARGLDRRRTATAFGLRAEAAGSIEPDCRQLGRCRRQGGRPARGFETAEAIAAAQAGGDGRAVPGSGESSNGSSSAARILKNEEGLPAKKVRRRMVQLLARMRRAVATTDEPAVRASLKQFVKVTRSYWPGLFACYESSDLPRTNNDLEHTFGSHRYRPRLGIVGVGSLLGISGVGSLLGIGGVGSLLAICGVGPLLGIGGVGSLLRIGGRRSWGLSPAENSFPVRPWSGRRWPGGVP